MIRQAFEPDLACRYKTDDATHFQDPKVQAPQAVRLMQMIYDGCIRRSSLRARQLTWIVLQDFFTQSLVFCSRFNPHCASYD